MVKNRDFKELETGYDLGIMALKERLRADIKALKEQIDQDPFYYTKKPIQEVIDKHLSKYLDNENRK